MLLSVCLLKKLLTWILDCSVLNACCRGLSIMWNMWEALLMLASMPHNLEWQLCVDTLCVIMPPAEIKPRKCTSQLGDTGLHEKSTAKTSVRVYMGVCMLSSAVSALMLNHIQQTSSKPYHFELYCCTTYRVLRGRLTLTSSDIFRPQCSKFNFHDVFPDR